MAEKIEFEYANSLVNYLGLLIKNKIMVNDIKIPFTILDYFSITDIDIYALSKIIKKFKINRSYYESMYKNAFLRFAEVEGPLTKIIAEVDDILDEHHAFIINGVKYVPTEEDIIKIFELFDEYDIPKYNKVIYCALHRIALGCPILPLLNEEEKNKRLLLSK